VIVCRELIFIVGSLTAFFFCLSLNDCRMTDTRAIITKYVSIIFKRVKFVFSIPVIF